MAGWLRYLITMVFIALWAQPLQANQDQINAAVEALGIQLDQCIFRVKKRDVEIKDLKQQIKNYKAGRTIDQQLIDDFERLKEVSARVIDRQQAVLQKSSQIENQLNTNMQLCRRSVSELQAALLELNQHYNTAAKDCLKPWYTRWEFWLGAIIGLAIGIPL